MLLTLALTTVIAACGPAELTDASTPGGAQGVAVTVTPDALSLAATASATFQATVTGSAITAVTWSVQEGSTGGTVTAAGVYTAPSAAGTYHLVAKSVSNPGVTSEATIAVSAAVTPPPPPPPTGLYPPDVAMARLSEPTLAEPGLGASVLFSDLGTTVTRSTNRLHHYPKTAVWNSDETLALVSPSPEVYTSSVRYLIDGSTYADIKDLLANQAVWPNEHRTWSNTNPHYIYGANKSGRQWIRIDVSTTPATTVALKTYSASDVGLSSLSTMSYGSYEGNMDNADSGVALIADDVRPVLVNPKTGAVRCYVTAGGGYGNTVSDTTMSQDGNWIIVNWDTYGLDAYRASDCSWARRLTTRTSHYDACVSTAGDQVAVQASGASAALEMIRLSDGKVTAVTEPNEDHLHVSCRNVKRPGWAYVSQSNYGCSAGDSTYAGEAIHNRVIAVKLDGSKLVENFAWSHQPCPATEAEVDFASPSPTGTRVWWKTNWDGASTGPHSFVAQQR